MTDLKFNLLKMLYDASPLHPLKEFDLINTGYAEPIKIDAAIEDLIEQKYIKTDPCSNSIKIDSPGRIAFESEKEHRDQQVTGKLKQKYRNKKSKKHTQKHTDNPQTGPNVKKQLAFKCVETILVLLLTKLIEHSPQLVAVILSLFK